MLPEHCHRSVAVAQGGDLAVARSVAEGLADGLALGHERRDRFSLIVAELGGNLLRHAQGGGTMLFRSLADPVGLECICMDRGPGIADPDRALRDGESSAHGLGFGLGAVRRLSDAFALHTAPGAGTAVLARVREGAGAARAVFAAGAVMVPMAGMEACGDGWIVTAGGVAAAIDGLGHGALASEAARRAEAAVAEGMDDPASVLEDIHLALRGTRGAVAAVVAAAPERIRFAGVGNIGAVLIRAEGQTHLASGWGVLGYNARRAPVQEAAWSAGDVLVLHSDGVGHVAEAFAARRLRGVDPTLAASVLLRDAAGRVDDQTVLVLANTSGT